MYVFVEKYEKYVPNTLSYFELWSIVSIIYDEGPLTNNPLMLNKHSEDIIITQFNIYIDVRNSGQLDSS